jgi:hypothetical protein
MVYHALECVDDAVEATRDFLLPVDRGLWLKLAVVVFFLSGSSGVGSLPNTSFSFSAGEVDVSGLPSGDVSPAELLDQFLPVLVGLFAALLLVGALFALVGSVMEFVLVDALRSESVAVRASMREHLGGGLALFAFRLLLGLVVLSVLAATAFLLVVPAVGTGSDVQVVFGVLAVLFVGLIVVVPAAIVHGLTTEFVVPTMMHEDRGLRSAWRRFWPVLRANLGQFAVYVVVRLALTIGVGIIAGIVVGIAAVVVGLPFALVGGAAWLSFGGSLTVTSALVYGLVVAAYIIVVLAVTAVVQVPLKTFTRYYELLVLGDVDPDLDLVAERREAVRSGGF